MLPQVTNLPATTRLLHAVTAALTSSFCFANNLTKVATLGVAQQMLDVTGQPVLHAFLGLLCVAFKMFKLSLASTCACGDAVLVDIVPYDIYILANSARYV